MFMPKKIMYFLPFLFEQDKIKRKKKPCVDDSSFDFWF